MICIDPGLRGCGVAVFNRGDAQLIRACYVPNDERVGRGPKVWVAMAKKVKFVLLSLTGLTARFYLEVPQVYGGPRDEDPNDLIDLAGVVGAIAAMFPDSIHSFYLPRQWKGTVPKKMMTQRISEQLAPEELKVIQTAGAKDHNTLDAIGIGLFTLGRLEQKRKA